MLKVKNLSFSYSRNVAFYFPDVQLADNESLLIIGKSGAGKSTFLHLLSGILSPEKGEVVIDNTSIGRLSKYQRDRFRGKHIGLVFQQPHLINALSVVDNLRMAQYFNGLKNEKRISEILEANGLHSKRNVKPSQLSQGEQQRLAIARGILNEPRLIIADEPTSALDDENTYNVATLLRIQAEMYKANLIIATHDQRLKDMFPTKILLQ